MSSLWPRETDLSSLLPKPDGTFRSIYTGSPHPKLINEFVLGAPLNFGEIIIQHPFINPMSLAEEMRPTHDPHAYRGEVLKSLMTFLSIFPLVHAGLVHLIPDPWDFDLHLRDQTMSLAEARRTRISFNPKDDPRMDAVIDEDMRRMMLGLPKEALLSQLAKLPQSEQLANPNDMLQYIDQMRFKDPLAVLQENTVGAGGQFAIMKMAPNFEMPCISPKQPVPKFLPTVRSAGRIASGFEPQISRYRACAAKPADGCPIGPFRFPVGYGPLMQLKEGQAFAGVKSVFDGAYQYLRKRNAGETKPNFEVQLAARFRRNKQAADAEIEKANVPHTLGKVSSIFRLGGLQDNTVNRLLLMSSSEHHLQSVPMATYISRLESHLAQ